MHTKTKGVLLSILSIVGLTSIVILYLITQRLNDRRNNFIRLFPPHIVWLQGKIDIGVNSYYIAGSTGSYVFLGNRTTPSYIMQSDMKCINTSRRRLLLSYDSNILYDRGQYDIDSPSIRFVDQISKSVLTTASWNDSLKITKLPKSLISQTIFLNPRSVICETYDLKNDESYLNKFDLYSKHDKATLKLPKQFEGLYSTDGKLSIDKRSKSIIFVFRYRNQFLIIDSNLQLIHVHNTIDTNTFAKVQRAFIASQNKITMTAPPVTINSGSAVWSGRLYIKSPLLSSNEDRSYFKDSEPIDVYNTSTGSYLHSFYLPKINNNQCKEFIVRDSNLIAIYDHFLLSFKLRE